MISRIDIGLIMIGVSIFLFLIAGSIDDFESSMSVAGKAFLENTLLGAGLLTGLGIYLAYFSKPCPVCGEQLSRMASECYFCGHNL